MEDEIRGIVASVWLDFFHSIGCNGLRFTFAGVFYHSASLCRSLSGAVSLKGTSVVLDADSSNTMWSFVVDWETGLLPMICSNCVFWVMILGGKGALYVVTRTCFDIVEYAGVVGAKGDFSEISLVRDLSDVAICGLSRQV